MTPLDELRERNKHHGFVVDVPPSLMEEYYLEVGRFISMFSRAEESLKHEVSTLVSQSAAPRGTHGNAVLKLVVKTATVGPAMDMLRDLLKATKVSKATRDSVATILKHLGEMRFLRDRLAHAPAYLNMQNLEGWFEVSNSATASEFEKLETVAFKVETLKDMSDDLKRLPDMLSDVISPPSPDHVTYLDTESEGMKRHLAWLASPWRFKPSDIKRMGPRHDPSLRGGP